MMEQFGKALLNVAFAGVGAVAIAAEKAGEVGKVLIERGEQAVEQGRQCSEELQQKVPNEVAAVVFNPAVL